MTITFKNFCIHYFFFKILYKYSNKIILFRHDWKRKPWLQFETYRPQLNPKAKFIAAVCLDAADGANIQGFFRIALDGSESLRTKLNLNKLFNVNLFDDYDVELSLHPKELIFQEFNLLLIFFFS